ncbi:hypothetical protein GCM10022225_73460 [Plantactinospora mayteni]|uniref:Uncharacterized protein n=1 Tax=Plantactinospora mayteni TaxID=566021 RepID=A0ABQ4F1K5_9ACTN|nr:hypothetical protein [Plantactinospora mayteni]GIH00801.1 hypothetical protein Pma05_73730 [Plantactinospora mayteni]
MGFTALTEPGHHGQTYPLTGPEALTLAAQVEQIGAVIDRKLVFEELTVEQARVELARHVPDMVVDYFLEVRVRVRRDVLDTVEDITGRPARTFRQWAEENADAFR